MEVYRPDCVFETRRLPIYTPPMRRKTDPDAARPRYLLTEQGIENRAAAP